MNDRFGLSERSYNELIDILTSVPEIEEARIFGSRARGDHSSASDVDLLLAGKLLTSHTLAVINDKLYESHIPYFFDTLLAEKVTNPKLLANIHRDGKVIYRKGN